MIKRILLIIFGLLIFLNIMAFISIKYFNYYINKPKRPYHIDHSVIELMPKKIINFPPSGCWVLHYVSSDCHYCSMKKYTSGWFHLERKFNQISCLIYIISPNGYDSPLDGDSNHHKYILLVTNKFAEQTEFTRTPNTEIGYGDNVLIRYAGIIQSNFVKKCIKLIKDYKS